MVLCGAVSGKKLRAVLSLRAQFEWFETAKRSAHSNLLWGLLYSAVRRVHP
jgi:hypothetical protein